MPDSPQDKNQEVRTEWQAAGDLGPDRLFHGSSDERGAGGGGYLSWIFLYAFLISLEYRFAGEI